MSRSTSRFARWGSVVWERPSRHLGLDVTVVARREDTRQPFLAYLHTADRECVVAVSEGRSPETVAKRVEDVFDGALRRAYAGDRQPAQPASVFGKRVGPTGATDRHLRIGEG